MRIRGTVPAADDLQNIKNYLQQHYPLFAETTVRTLYERIRSLKTSPNRGRPGHVSGTRELAVTPLPYVVVYAVKADAVEILQIYHGRKTRADLAFQAQKSNPDQRVMVESGFIVAPVIQSPKTAARRLPLLFRFSDHLNDARLLLG